MVPEIVTDSKLSVTFHDGYVSHEVFDSDIGGRRRKKEELWQRQRFLEHGGFGTVWLEKCTNGASESKLRAVKNVSKTSCSAPPIDYTRELEAIAKFSQRKYDGLFVKSYGWFEGVDSVFITMEYFELRDLQKHLGQPLPEADAQQISYQVLEGLEHLHANGFAHRDLKPANIFVVQKRPRWWVKIGDFGISKRFHEDTAFRTAIGTETYLAPEVLFQRFGDSQAYTFMVDMWSLGVMTHYLLTRSLPFKSFSEVFAYTQDHRFPTADLQSHCVGLECQDFIKLLLAAKPSSRLSAEDALEHDWIKMELEATSSLTTDSTGDGALQGQIAIQSNATSSLSSGRWTTVIQSAPRAHGVVEQATRLPEATQAAVMPHEQEQLEKRRKEQKAELALKQKKKELALMRVSRQRQAERQGKDQEQEAKLQPELDQGDVPPTSPPTQRTLATLQQQQKPSAGTMSRHQVPRPPPFSKPEVHLKIVTIGNTFCGKTCLLTAFVQGTMPKAYIPTTFDVHTANMMLDGKHVELILPGTAHYGSFASYRPESYSKPHVVLICFEIGEAPGCLAGLKGWIREAHEFARGLPIILVGCKQDLRDSPKGGNLISEVEAEAVAGEIGASRYLECSARTGKGVLEVFEVAARVALMPKQTGWWRRIPGLR